MFYYVHVNTSHFAVVLKFDMPINFTGTVCPGCTHFSIYPRKYFPSYTVDMCGIHLGCCVYEQIQPHLEPIVTAVTVELFLTVTIN